MDLRIILLNVFHDDFSEMLNRILGQAPSMFTDLFCLIRNAGQDI
jgi:hypothetical protein